MLWANYKKDKDERAKQHELYDNNPQMALSHTKEIIKRLAQDQDEDFRLFNHSIPVDVCSILLTDFFDKISAEERKYCKDVVLDFAKMPTNPYYRYQFSDGIASAIDALPIIFINYPTERANIKSILLRSLFNDYPIGMWTDSRYSIFPGRAILQLWESHFDDMQSILFGYLLLKPHWNKILEKSYKQVVFDNREDQFHDDFYNQHENDLLKIDDNLITISDLNNIEETDLYILNSAFQLLPLNTANYEHKLLAQSIISIFAKRLLTRDQDNKINYDVRHSFIEKLAYLVLSSSEQDIKDYLQPFLDGFNGSETIAELFEQFIFAEDKMDTYDKFWQVWTLFYVKVVDLCAEGDEYRHVEKIIKSYLFARTPFKETVTDWHTFKDSNSRFFEDIAKYIGHCPSTLYALAKLLNDIADQYLNLGISWLSGILTRNKKLWTGKLETHTINYLEKLVRKYIYKEREQIRRSKQLKDEVLIILNFLVERGSVIGYMLRDNIL